MWKYRRLAEFLLNNLSIRKCVKSAELQVNNECFTCLGRKEIKLELKATQLHGGNKTLRCVEGWKKSEHRKVVQDRGRANRGTEAWVSKACEDGRRETNLLQTVFFIQRQISLKPGVIKLVCKVGILSSSLTLKLKEKSDCSLLKWGNKKAKIF